MKSENSRLVIAIEKRLLDKRTGQISFQFRIGPFKKSMATTIGSALRRTLLAMSQTVAITTACGKFSEGNCIREDLFELSLNLQRVHIKSSFFPYFGTAYIHKKGPAIVTAQDLKLEEGLEVVNPYQYICTINDTYDLDLCVMISSPKVNNTLDSINPINNLIFKQRNSLPKREYELTSLFDKDFSTFPSNGQLDKSNEKTINEQNSLKLKKSLSNPRGVSYTKASKMETFVDIGKESKTKLSSAQKLSNEIIIIDPIYSPIQSCGFEIVQTTTSSVSEYEELIKTGISDTAEFLRFVVVSRGSIEPALAIQLAVQDLSETFSSIEPLSHVFACEKNIFLSLENFSQQYLNNKSRGNIKTLYTFEILKKLDIRHLSLPPELELFLRREGFVNFKNLITVPLEFLRRIGLNEKELNIIQNALNLYGLSINTDKNMKWELIPTSLSF